VGKNVRWVLMETMRARADPESAAVPHL